MIISNQSLNKPERTSFFTIITVLLNESGWLQLLYTIKADQFSTAVIIFTIQLESLVELT
jgi:hypothetical protein